MKNEQFNVSMPLQLKRQIAEAAKMNGVSMATYIRDAVKLSLHRDQVQPTPTPIRAVQ